jgi:PAS domain S-box-containing protein
MKMRYQPKLENTREFRDYMIRSSMPSMRYGLIVTLCLFILFAGFNQIVYPGSPEQRYFLRFGVILPFIVISLVFLYVKRFQQSLEYLLFGVNLAVAVSIFFVGAFANFTVKGYSYYFTWTMLVFVGSAAFYRIRFRYFLIVGSLILLSYILATILNVSFRTDPEAFTNNLFFVISLATACFFVAWNIFDLNRQNFSHQKAIEKNYVELMNGIRDRDKAEKNLQESEDEYLVTLNSIPDSIFVIDKNLDMVFANGQMMQHNKRLGLEMDVIGKKFYAVYPFLSEETVKETKEVFTTGKPMLTTQRLKVAGQEWITETRKIPILKDEKVDKVMAIIRDVTKEKQYEELKYKNAEQKELLLREIHHRVKNNLAIVISMLSLQARSNPDPTLTGIIQDIELRIRSMALIHEHLYRSETLDRIPLADYLKSLSAVIASTFQRANVEFVSEMESIDANIEAALPVGLIVNELLTNAFKYAFPEGNKGTITLGLKQLGDDKVELRISDSGIGLPDGFSLEEQPTLGMFMVRLLIEQIYGKLDLSNKNGTTFTITFSHNLI